VHGKEIGAGRFDDASVLERVFATLEASPELGGESPGTAARIVVSSARS
jgi:hypothetical protein